ncbi:hypothetical protein C4D60_Mb00t00010 [Musa balbisiana]|uniref:Uncharacterized protein n=1 Tax=Musa balbisiana TaxID=52838 RepID=A0A4S8I711_MUSBA|nr:hypothetical protein C4D60_Mb00t00010 [Musa balbisiana]
MGVSDPYGLTGEVPPLSIQRGAQKAFLLSFFWSRRNCLSSDCCGLAQLVFCCCFRFCWNYVVWFSNYPPTISLFGPTRNQWIRDTFRNK